MDKQAATFDLIRAQTVLEARRRLERLRRSKGMSRASVDLLRGKTAAGTSASSSDRDADEGHFGGLETTRFDPEDEFSAIDAFIARTSGAIAAAGRNYLRQSAPAPKRLISSWGARCT